MNDVPIITDWVHISKETKPFSPESFPCPPVTPAAGGMRSAGSLCLCRQPLPDREREKNRTSHFRAAAARSGDEPLPQGRHFQSVRVTVLVVEAG